jgi:hypothetical protein
VSAVSPQFGEGAALTISYTPNAAITGGQLVERINGTRLVQPAGAASLKVCGVARKDALATILSPEQVKVGDALGLPVSRFCVIAVTFAAAANPGDKLIAAASGQVTPLPAVDISDLAHAGTSITNTRAIIGEALNAVSLGAVGLAVIY